MARLTKDGKRVMKRRDIQFFRFTSPGDAIEGYLRDRQEYEGQNGPMAKITLETPDGYVGLNETTQLGSTLRVIPIGAFIRIEYEGDERTARGFNVRKFAVYEEVDDDGEPAIV